MELKPRIFDFLNFSKDWNINLTLKKVTINPKEGQMKFHAHTFLKIDNSAFSTATEI